MSGTLGVEHFASCRRCIERIRASWPAFLRVRASRLDEARRAGRPRRWPITPWKTSSRKCWTGHWLTSTIRSRERDILLTKHGTKYLLIKTKRPGALALHRRAVEGALDRARRYAPDERVRCIAVSDGTMLYAADMVSGGLKGRVFVSLAQDEPPLDLWWLSVHGLHRARSDTEGAELRILPGSPIEKEGEEQGSGEAGLLHPKYGLPARCFAYVGRAGRPATWKLPYRLAGGNVDENRLPKAIWAILSNYGGAKVSGIPEEDIPMLSLRLARAEASIERMPFVVSLNCNS